MELSIFEWDNIVALESKETEDCDEKNGDVEKGEKMSHEEWRSQSNLLRSNGYCFSVLKKKMIKLYHFNLIQQRILNETNCSLNPSEGKLVFKKK